MAQAAAPVRLALGRKVLHAVARAVPPGWSLWTDDIGLRADWYSPDRRVKIEVDAPNLVVSVLAHESSLLLRGPQDPEAVVRCLRALGILPPDGTS